MVKIEIASDRHAEFCDRMEALAPWMQHLRFSDTEIVGYHKQPGLGWDCTWCNHRSPEDVIRRMAKAYDAISHDTESALLADMIDGLDLSDRSNSTALVLSSATGKHAFVAADQGFGRVISSEIRCKQIEQQQLILTCAADDIYRSRIELFHDETSADDPSYVESYRPCRADVVLSLGLLYHLTNPVQHLMNLREITQRYVILNTATHSLPKGEGLWRLIMEDTSVITKAMAGISWTPHFHGLMRVIEQVGFKRCEIHYPEPYARNFPRYREGKEPTGGRIRDHLLVRFGIPSRAYRERQRYLANFDPKYFSQFDVRPSTFFYVLEK